MALHDEVQAAIEKQALSAHGPVRLDTDREAAAVPPDKLRLASELEQAKAELLRLADRVDELLVMLGPFL